MDKETLSNYGWIVIAVLVLAVMIALATPFGEYIKDAVWSTTVGLFDVTENALNVVGISTKETSKWQNRKWVAFGTSITDTNYIGADGTSTGKYVPYLATWSEMDLINHGVAGGRMSGHVLYYVKHYTKDLRWADLVTIEGSVNDYAGCVPLGAVGDTVPFQDDGTLEIGGTTEGTFAGACYQIFKTAQEKAPRATIVYLTESTGQYIPSTGANYTKGATNKLGLTQDDYIDMAVAVAESMGVMVIDAGGQSLIDENHPEYLSDHIHHSELGGQKYAEVVWNKLKTMQPKCEPLEPIFTGNYFDKNDNGIEYGGIYTSTGSWYSSANYFETGFIKVRTDAQLYLFGVDSAVHWCYYDIDTKEYIKGSNNGVVNGKIAFGSVQNIIPSYMKDYAYIRVGLPKVNTNDIVITVNEDGSIS